MKNLHLLSLILAFALFQTSCKDFWHPEEAKMATVTLRATGDYGVYGPTLHSVLDSNIYDFENVGAWSGFTKDSSSIRVPSGTYYITGLPHGSNSRIRSENFSVGERAKKTINYVGRGFASGEFQTE